MEGLVLKKVEMTLEELLMKKKLLMKLYSSVTSFQRMIEIDEKVITPLNRIFSLYDKKIKEIQKKNVNKKEVFESEFKLLLKEKVHFSLAVIKKEEVETVGLNVFEFREIREFIQM